MRRVQAGVVALIGARVGSCHSCVIACGALRIEVWRALFVALVWGIDTMLGVVAWACVGAALAGRAWRRG